MSLKTELSIAKLLINKKIFLFRHKYSVVQF